MYADNESRITHSTHNGFASTFLFQEEGSVEIVFDLIGFELDPEKSHQSGFFTPDFAHMWMNPADPTWKNRSGLALIPGSGLRPDEWRMRY